MGCDQLLGLRVRGLGDEEVERAGDVHSNSIAICGMRSSEEVDIRISCRRIGSIGGGGGGVGVREKACGTRGTPSRWPRAAGIAQLRDGLVNSPLARRAGRCNIRPLGFSMPSRGAPDYPPTASTGDHPPWFAVRRTPCIVPVYGIDWWPAVHLWGYERAECECAAFPEFVWYART